MDISDDPPYEPSQLELELAREGWVFFNNTDRSINLEDFMAFAKAYFPEVRMEEEAYDANGDRLPHRVAFYVRGKKIKEDEQLPSFKEWLQRPR